MNRCSGLFFLFLFLAIKTLTADWVNVNIGINDNFNAVSFTGDRGVLAGDKGTYYTIRDFKTKQLAIIKNKNGAPDH